jgi:hypothetical protein
VFGEECEDVGLGLAFLKFSSNVGLVWTLCWVKLAWVWRICWIGFGIFKIFIQRYWPRLNTVLDKIGLGLAKMLDWVWHCLKFSSNVVGLVWALCWVVLAWVWQRCWIEFGIIINIVGLVWALTLHVLHGNMLLSTCRGFGDQVVSALAFHLWGRRFRPQWVLSQCDSNPVLMWKQ